MFCKEQSTNLVFTDSQLYADVCVTIMALWIKVCDFSCVNHIQLTKRMSKTQCFLLGVEPVGTGKRWGEAGD